MSFWWGRNSPLRKEEKDMNFEEIIRKRTATRKFQNILVEQEKLEKVLEAGRLAPTAKNYQPQHFFVIKTKKGFAKIDKASPCRYGAPIVVMVCSDKEIAFHQNNYSTYEMDATISATHMILEATNVGLDSIWVEMFDRNILKKEFHLKESLEVVCLLMLGYKSSDCPVNPMHSIRKPLHEMVEYIE